MRNARFLLLLFVPTLVAAQVPVLDVTPLRLTFIAAAGSAAPMGQRLVIKNAGQGSLSWRVIPSAPWIKVSPATGQGQGETAVSIDASRLSPGTHSGRLTVSSAGEAGVAPVVVEISAQIVAPRSVAPDTGTEPAGQQGVRTPPGGKPAPSGPRLDLTSPAGSSVLVESGVTIDSPAAAPEEWFAKSDQTWLTVEPRTGMTPTRVVIRANPAGLIAGTHAAVLRFADDAGDPMLVVPVSLTIGVAAAEAPGPGQTPAAGPPAAGQAPAATVPVRRPGDTLLSIQMESLTPAMRNLPYSQAITVTGGQPPYGMTIIEGRLPVGIIFANGALTGLTKFPGTYPLTFSVIDSSSPPQVATKSLVLSVIYALQGTALSVTHSSVSIVGRAGHVTPGLRIGIQSGTQPLPWAASVDQPWIRASPAQGRAPGLIQIDVDAKSLDPGTYVGTLTITMEGAPNSPMRIPVQATVRK